MNGASTFPFISYSKWSVMLTFDKLNNLKQNGQFQLTSFWPFAVILQVANMRRIWVRNRLLWMLQHPVQGLIILERRFLWVIIWTKCWVPLFFWHWYAWEQDLLTRPYSIAQYMYRNWVNCWYWDWEMGWYTQANVRCSYDRDLPTLYQRLSQT